MVFLTIEHPDENFLKSQKFKILYGFRTVVAKELEFGIHFVS